MIQRQCNKLGCYRNRMPPLSTLGCDRNRVQLLSKASNNIQTNNILYDITGFTQNRHLIPVATKCNIVQNINFVVLPGRKKKRLQQRQNVVHSINSMSTNSSTKLFIFLFIIMDKIDHN